MSHGFAVIASEGVIWRNESLSDWPAHNKGEKRKGRPSIVYLPTMFVGTTLEDTSSSRSSRSSGSNAIEIGCPGRGVGVVGLSFSVRWETDRPPPGALGK